MAWGIDLALLLLLGLIVFLAARRGFFAVALQLGAWIVSIALAGALSSMLAQPIYEALFAGMVRQAIESSLDSAIQGSQVAQYAQQVIRDLPDALTQLGQAAGVSTQDLIGNLEAQRFTTANAAQLLESSIAAPLATAAIRFALALLLFMLLIIVTRLICRKIAKINKLPVLKQADRILGAALGLVKGVLLLLALCLGLRAVAALGIAGPDFAAAVEGSRLVAAMEWIRL